MDINSHKSLLTNQQKFLQYKPPHNIYYLFASLRNYKVGIYKHMYLFSYLRRFQMVQNYQDNDIHKVW
jgi:hypothetical protein